MKTDIIKREKVNIDKDDKVNTFLNDLPVHRQKNADGFCYGFKVTIAGLLDKEWILRSYVELLLVYYYPETFGKGPMVRFIYPSPEYGVTEWMTTFGEFKENFYSWS